MKQDTHESKSEKGSNPQEYRSGRGIYATHLLIYPNSTKRESLVYFSRIEGMPENEFYMERRFGRRTVLSYKEIERNVKVQGKGRLINLGKEGIPINIENYFKIKDGEIHLCDGRGSERIEDILSKQ